MKKEITDTTKNPHPEWVMGGNPGAIKTQEEQGQKELVESCQFPARINSPRGLSIAAAYEKLGIKFVRYTGDDLFFEVELPAGWKIVATDHTMWSNLIDEDGKITASIFYKAAFYDRDAFFNIKE